MKLVHFKKHSCIEKKYHCLAHENFNLPIAINPDHIVAISPRCRTKMFDTDDSVYSSDVWCELKTVSGCIWSVDGSYEEVTDKLSEKNTKSKKPTSYHKYYLDEAYNRREKVSRDLSRVTKQDASAGIVSSREQDDLRYALSDCDAVIDFLNSLTEPKV